MKLEKAETIFKELITEIEHLHNQETELQVHLKQIQDLTNPKIGK